MEAILLVNQALLCMTDHIVLAYTHLESKSLQNPHLLRINPDYALTDLHMHTGQLPLVILTKYQTYL